MAKSKAAKGEAAKGEVPAHELTAAEERDRAKKHAAAAAGPAPPGRARRQCVGKGVHMYAPNGLAASKYRNPGMHWSITGTVNMPFNIKVPLMCVTRPVTRYGRSTGRLTGC